MQLYPSNMNKYDYKHTQNKMLYTERKPIQQIQIKDITLSNTIGLESNTLKHYFFNKTAIIQIQYCLLDKNNMNLLDSVQPNRGLI